MFEDRVITFSDVALKIAVWVIILAGLEYAIGKSSGEIFTRIYWMAAGGFGVYFTERRRLPRVHA